MTDLEIAHATKLAHIDDVAAQMGIVPDELEHYGKHIAKLPLSLMGAPKGKLILVTAITATKAGIGKPPFPSVWPWASTALARKQSWHCANLHWVLASA